MSVPHQPPACEICFTRPLHAATLRHCPRCTAHVCPSCFSAWLNVRIQYATANNLTCLSCPEPIPDDELHAVVGDRAFRRCLYLRSRFAHRDDPDAAWCPTDGCWALLPPSSSSPPPPPPPLLSSPPSSFFSTRSLPNQSATSLRSPPPSRLRMNNRFSTTTTTNNTSNKNTSPTLPTRDAPHTIVCTHCETAVCAYCKQLAHPGRCPVAVARPGHRVATAFWRRLHTKKCPSCSVRIQRAGGCTQMHCTSCHTKFCWRCRGLLHVPTPIPPPPPPPPPPGMAAHMSGGGVVASSSSSSSASASASASVAATDMVAMQPAVWSAVGPTGPAPRRSPYATVLSGPGISLTVTTAPTSMIMRTGSTAGVGAGAGSGNDDDDGQFVGSGQMLKSAPQRQLYGCVCPRVHSVLSHIGVAGGVVIAAPVVLAAAVVAAPPAVVAYACLSKQQKEQMRKDIAGLTHRT